MTETASSAMPLSQASLRLAAARRVLVLVHHNPDGDALGSAAGLAAALEKRGVSAGLLLRGSWSDHLNFLLEGLTLVPETDDFQDYDLAVLLDCHSYDRLGPEAGALIAKLDGSFGPDSLVVVDHHLLSEGESPSPLWLYQPKASSTAEIVWLELIKPLGWKPSPRAAEALLLGLVSDTGFFSQSNTTPGALNAAADLTALGGNLAEINRRIKLDLPLRRLKLMGLVLDSLELHFQGRLAVMTVTPDQLRAARAQMADTEDFVELGRGLAGVAMSALIKDNGGGPGTVRVSLRSREPVDAQALAKTFGGGGHREASAYNDPRAENAAEAAANLLARAESFL